MPQTPAFRLASADKTKTSDHHGSDEPPCDIHGPILENCRRFHVMYSQEHRSIGQFMRNLWDLQIARLLDLISWGGAAHSMAIRLQRAQLESMSRSCNSLRLVITRQLYAQDPTSWQHNPKKKKKNENKSCGFLIIQVGSWDSHFGTVKTTRLGFWSLLNCKHISLSIFLLCLCACVSGMHVSMEAGLEGRSLKRRANLKWSY